MCYMLVTPKYILTLHGKEVTTHFQHPCSGYTQYTVAEWLAFLLSIHKAQGLDPGQEIDHFESGFFVVFLSLYRQILG